MTCTAAACSEQVPYTDTFVKEQGKRSHAALGGNAAINDVHRVTAYKQDKKEEQQDGHEMVGTCLVGSC